MERVSHASDDPYRRTSMQQVHGLHGLHEPHGMYGMLVAQHKQGEMGVGLLKGGEVGCRLHASCLMHLISSRFERLGFFQETKHFAVVVRLSPPSLPFKSLVDS